MLLGVSPLREAARMEAMELISGCRWGRLIGRYEWRSTSRFLKMFLFTRYFWNSPMDEVSSGIISGEELRSGDMAPAPLKLIVFSLFINPSSSCGNIAIFPFFHKITPIIVNLERWFPCPEPLCPVHPARPPLEADDGGGTRSFTWR